MGPNGHVKQHGEPLQNSDKFDSGRDRVDRMATRWGGGINIAKGQIRGSIATFYPSSQFNVLASLNKVASANLSRPMQVEEDYPPGQENKCFITWTPLEPEIFLHFGATS